MNHVKDQLSSYIDRELRADQVRGIESHLAQCGECRAVLEDLRAGAARLRSAGKSDLPAGFMDRLNRKYRRSMEEPVQRGFEFPYFKLAAVALAGLLVMVVVRNKPKPEREPESQSSSLLDRKIEAFKEQGVELQSDELKKDAPEMRYRATTPVYEKQEQARSKVPKVGQKNEVSQISPPPAQGIIREEGAPAQEFMKAQGEKSETEEEPAVASESRRLTEGSQNKELDEAERIAGIAGRVRRDEPKAAEAPKDRVELSKEAIQFAKTFKLELGRTLESKLASARLEDSELRTQRKSAGSKDNLGSYRAFGGSEETLSKEVPQSRPRSPALSIAVPLEESPRWESVPLTDDVYIVSTDPDYKFEVNLKEKTIKGLNEASKKVLAP